MVLYYTVVYYTSINSTLHIKIILPNKSCFFLSTVFDTFQLLVRQFQCFIHFQAIFNFAETVNEFKQLRRPQSPGHVPAKLLWQKKCMITIQVTVMHYYYLSNNDAL